MLIRGCQDGPVIILGSADSLFVGQMAGFFQERGHEVRIVSLQPRGDAIPDSISVTDGGKRSRLGRLSMRLIRPVVHATERCWTRLRLAKFRRATGKEHPDRWEWAVWDQAEHAWRLSRIALAQRPRLVLGQEVAGYGLPTALCRGVPRILHPWGSDIYLTPESWPGANWLVTYALRNAELIVPSAVTAAEHLIRRFGVNAENVCGISYGIDPQLVRCVDRVERAQICNRWNINSDAVIVQNCRRFRRQWGSEPALESFLAVASVRPQAHFVLIGGGERTPELLDAAQRLAAAGLSERFTVIDRRLSVEEYNELALVTDISVSLMQRGDLRSASVLTTAAAGAAQVIAEHPEFRAMQCDGFKATFVDPAQTQLLRDALVELIDDPELRRSEGTANRRYILECENRPRQIQKVMNRIDEVCTSFYSKRAG